MLSDRFRLRKSLKRLQKSSSEKEREKLRERIEASVKRAEARAQRKPTCTFPADLPVNQHRDEITQLIQDHQVVIVCGETGSGKSTQLPKICLEAGRGVYGMIGHTQPRRIAARSVGARVAEELGVKLGAEVGFKIRFSDQTTDKTYIKLMTDGILLAETQFDRFLEKYDTLIIDEAHERSLNIDFILGFLKTIISKRPEFKLIITSATIDAEKFSQHFAKDEVPAPIIEVSGRSYPVETLYRPMERDEGVELDLFEGINDAITELLSTESGDCLIFLPTEKDIRTAANKLRGLEYLKRSSIKTEILPLYARLSVAEQNKIFKPGPARRIVLATNVAESSLTVPRIKYVIDSGLARISRYAPRSKIQRLPIEKISQASANQRAGRCGRLGPGVCIRLYSEEDFAARDAFTTPEIRRTNLASVILQAKAMRFGDVDQIQFLDPPRPESVKDGYKTLFEIGATDLDKRLTPLGNKIKHFPCDPRISRMILAGDREGVLADTLIVAAALEVQDVRDRPVEKQQLADEAHQQFVSPESDFVTLLNIWDFYHRQKAKLSNSQLRKSLQQNFLSFIRIREWLDVYRQLRELCVQQKLKIGQRKNQPDNLHRSILAGILSGIAQRGDKYEYQGAGGTRFYLWPGSGLTEQAPKWLVGTEIVETSRRYIRNAARIQPAWIEPLAKHLVTKSHSDPFWHEKSEKVMANEKVSLFGLTIVPRRSVPFAKIDPDLSRQIFIEEGLCGDRLIHRHPFQTHNRQVIDQAKSMVDKTRRRELIVDDVTIFSFYEERIPQHVHDGISLRDWLKADPQNDNSLQLTLEDLIPTEDDEIGDDFPDSIPTQSIELPLRYSFEPGNELDGLSTEVPAVAISQVNAARLEWLVPGMLTDKIAALIRSLPKSKRRAFVPAPQKAGEIAERIEFAQGDLLKVVAAELSRIANEPIQVSDFDVSKVDRHLKMSVQLTDEAGQVIETSRDLPALQEKYCGDDTSQNFLQASNQVWEGAGIREWSFGPIPSAVTVSHGGIEIQGFPAVVDEGTAVSLRIFPTQALAQHETSLGVMRLAALRNKKSLKQQLRWLPALDQYAVTATQFTQPDALKRMLSDLIAKRAFVDLQSALPSNEEEFEILNSSAVEQLSIAAQDLASLLPKFFERYQQMKLALSEKPKEPFGEVLAAIKTQLKALMPDDFWITTPWNWLLRYPTYFQAIEKRLEKLAKPQLSKERELESLFVDHLENFETIQRRMKSQGEFDPELIKYRFMIEEFRVSVFSQQLGTALPVSEKRLEKQLAKFGR